MVFWNVDGYRNLNLIDNYTINILANSNIVGILETWKDTPITKGPIFMREFELIQVPATKTFGPGRSSGGLLLFIRRSQNTPSAKVISSSANWIIIESFINNFRAFYCLAYFIPVEDPNDAVGNFLDRLSAITSSNPGCPVFVCGDFNARLADLNQLDDDIYLNPRLTSVRTSLDLKANARGRKWTEEMESLGFAILNGRTKSDSPAQLTFLHSNGASSIDQIWCNDAGLNHVMDSKVLPHGGRPHHLIYGLSISQNTESTLAKGRPLSISSQLCETYKWSYSNCGPATFRRGIDSSSALHSTQGLNMTQQNEQLVRVIKVAASAAGFCQISKPRGCYPKSSTPIWVDKDCRSLSKHIRVLHKEFVADRQDQPKLQTYLQAKKQLAKMILHKEKEHKRKIANALSNSRNPVEFWFIYRRLNPRISQPCPISIETWEEYYVSNYTYISTPINLVNNEDYNPYLDATITTEECAKCLSAIKNSKAPGPDGLSNEYFKNLTDSGILALTNLFNEVLNSGKIPDSWGSVKTIVLHKKGNPLDPDNYRNISLFNCISKIYTQILASRLQKFVEFIRLLPEHQGGFRELRSCEDNLFTLLAAIQIITNQEGRYLYAIFVDFRQAFDSVQHDKLWMKFDSLGLQSRAINSIKDLYTKLNMFYMVNGEKSKPLKINKGTPQGESLSPLLFLLFLSDIEAHFRQAGLAGVGLGGDLEILLMAFADDIVILAESPVDAQRKLNALLEYTECNGLTVNIKKTKMMIFHRSPHRKPPPRLKYGNSELGIVKFYTYLGIDFSNSGKFNLATQARIKKATQSIGAIRTPLLEANPKSTYAAEKLLRTTTTATLLYASEIWADETNGNLNKLESVKSKYYKLMLGWPKCTPHYIVRLETKSTSIAVEVLKRKLNWLVKLLNMADDRYPKRCYLKLLRRSNLNLDNGAPNWVSNMRNYLASLGYSDVFESQDREVIRANRDTILKALTSKIWREDMRRASQSSYSQIYHQTILDANYLHLDLNMKKLGLISQVRVASSSKRFLHWKGQFIILDASSTCPCCGTGQIDNLLHFILVCPLFDGFRDNFIDDTSLIQTLKTNNVEKAEKLFIYVAKAIKLRSATL